MKVSRCSGSQSSSDSGAVLIVGDSPSGPRAAYYDGTRFFSYRVEAPGVLEWVSRAGGELLLGSGHNRRVQNDDPSVHGETDAFRNAGRQRDYRSTIMVTTLSPCWYCSGLVRQFNIGAVIIGEARTFSGGHDWLAEHGVRITLLDDERCVSMMTDFIAENPALWNEDIGVSE